MPPESDGRFGPRTLGALQLADVGCQLHSDPERLRKVDSPVGGILVAIEDSTRVDPETGEIDLRRAFKVWDVYQSNGAGRPAGGYLVIPEAMCGPDSVQGVDMGLTTAATAQMARQYYDRRGKTGRRLLVGYDADLAHHLHLLARVLMGGAL